MQLTQLDMNLFSPESNVWFIKIWTIHRLSLWLYYDFYGKSSFHIVNFSCQDLENEVYLVPLQYYYPKIFIKAQRQIMFGSIFYESGVIIELWDSAFGIYWICWIKDMNIFISIISILFIAKKKQILLSLLFILIAKHLELQVPAQICWPLIYRKSPAITLNCSNF